MPAPLAAWVLSALLTLSPPERHRPPPGWHETPDAAQARYASIAEDIAAVARTRAEAAALVGVGWHESGFAVDVDVGPCYRGPGWLSRCDGGRAITLWQLQGGAPEDRDVWRTDRRAAAAEALRRIVRSLRACKDNDPAERLAAFAGGTCGGTAARKAARGLDAAVRKALALP